MSITTGLPPRYEIRTLGPQHLDWASAIVVHSNTFYSPVFAVLYSDSQTARCYRAFEAVKYLVSHQVNSGLSLGVFNMQWTPRRPDSSEGKLWWDVADENADRHRLLEQMDFPLVSVALSYDSFNPLDDVRMTPLIACLPAFGDIYRILVQLDQRDPTTWKASGPGQVLFRAATSTRADAEGNGFMKLLAHYLMRKSAAEGWRGIQIECAHEAVHHVWTNPPPPFRGDLISSFRAEAYEEKSENGETMKPLAGPSQLLSKVYVTLK